jgi:hypothetical protein
MDRPSRQRLCRIAVAVLFAAGLAASARAQTNMARNPGFDTGPLPWSWTGVAAWVAAGGRTSPGAISCTDPSGCQLGQCVDLSALVHPQTFDYQIALSHGGDTTSLALFAIVYPNPTCSGFGQTVGFTEFFFPPQAWTDIGATFDSLADTLSVQIIFAPGAAFQGPPADALLDDASLEADFGPIFLDGFESGDTSEWSASVP